MLVSPVSCKQLVFAYGYQLSQPVDRNCTTTLFDNLLIVVVIEGIYVFGVESKRTT